MIGDSKIGILLTALSGFFAVVILLIAYLKYRKVTLGGILLTCFCANLIWWLALCLEHLNNIKREFSSLTVTVCILLVLSSIFILRFLFFISFLKLVIRFLDITLSKKVFRILKLSISVILILWCLSLIEVPLNGTRRVADNLMLYTDIMIFTGITIVGLYMLFRAPLIANSRNKKAIIKLSYVFLFLCFFGLIKWMTGNALSAGSPLSERILLYVTLGSFNILIILWAFRYSSQITDKVAILKIHDPANPVDFQSKYNLSDREMEVVRLVSEGKTNKEISEALFISVETIKDHNSNIFLKTGVTNRTQLANIFFKYRSQNP